MTVPGCSRRLGQTSSIAFPFSCLDREPFWHLVPREGQAVSASRINNTSSVGYLRGYAMGARLDEDLFRISQTEDGRATLREVLQRSCFSPAAGAALAEQAGINAEAYHYSLDLLDQAHRHQPKIAETLAADAFRPPARDQGFRRVVVMAYEHRCALCGVRIITPEGHTVVDAAHIVPWRQSRNDDIRNGMALCKLLLIYSNLYNYYAISWYNYIEARRSWTKSRIPFLPVRVHHRPNLPVAMVSWSRRRFCWAAFRPDDRKRVCCLPD